MPDTCPTVPERLSPDALRWHCVRTGLNQELTADIQIRLLGFQVFNPSVWKRATRPWRDANGVTKRGKPDRIEPLFKRYLFVRFSRSDPWRPIWRLPGVDYVFSSVPGAPVPVPDDAIDAIRSQCWANDCIYPANHGERPAPLAVGSSAQLVDGPLRELTGIVRMSDGRRVELLLQIMGRSVQVTVRQAELEAV